MLGKSKKARSFVSRGTIPMGHARSLLSLKDQERQIELGERIATGSLSVCGVELMVSGEKEPSPSKEYASDGQPKPLATKSPHILDLEDEPRYIVVTKVSIIEKNWK